MQPIFFSNILNEKQLKNFWGKVEFTTDCWNWKGATNGIGYGQFGVNYKLLLVHRLIYKIYHCEIPEGLTIDHLCRNKLCVNPNHLEVVTNMENNLRGYSLSAQNARKINCIKGHPLNGDNLYKYKNMRQCKICISEKSKFQNHKKQAFKRIGELLN